MSKIIKNVKLNIKGLIIWSVIAILSILVIYVLFFNSPSSSSNALSAGNTARQVASNTMVGAC